jgi:anhydro-N-acetylmuramic acid kinase
VALCRISPARDAGETPRVKLLGHVGVSYPKAVRAAVLCAMDADAISVAELSRLNWRLGEVYADAVEKAQNTLGVKAGLVGCHGQTVYHQGAAEKYLGKNVRATWQIGEAAVIAERLRVPVVSDFRPADIAAGGQGAPLVPMLDYCMFRSAKVSRVLQNLGGIGNLTAIPAEAGVDGVMAFDTGPGNMVIDACMSASSIRVVQWLVQGGCCRRWWRRF